MFPPSLSLLIFSLIGSVLALRMEDADEGSCKGIPTRPFPVNDLTFMDKLTYIPAASRYNYYLIAAANPRFGEMTETELVNSMCLTHNVQTSKPVSQGSAFAFGSRAGNFTARQVSGQLGAFQVGADPDPANPQAPLATVTQTLTLTDYKTFAFFVLCWNTDSPHKAWEIYTLTPQVSSSTKRLIENHAVSLGFNQQNFVYLNFNNCGGSASGANRRYNGGRPLAVNKRFKQKY